MQFAVYIFISIHIFQVFALWILNTVVAYAINTNPGVSLTEEIMHWNKCSDSHLAKPPPSNFSITKQGQPVTRHAIREANIYSKYFLVHLQNG